MSRKSDIRLRRSNVLNAVPGGANLSDGELAINTNTGALYFKKSDNTIITAVDNTIFHIDSDTGNSGANKKIGIGTTSPANTLHVNSGSDNNVARFESTDGGAVITLKDNTGAAAVANIGDNLYFKTSSSQTDRMTILSNGKVGIGTTSPNALLDLEGVTASSSPILRFTGTGNASQGDVLGQIEFYNSDTTDNTAGIMGKIRAVAGPSGGEGSIQFLVDMPSEGADANNVALHLNSNGNVGIGTDSPSQKLTVEGNIELGTGGYIYGDTTTPRLRLSNSAGSQLSYGTGVLSVAPSLTYSSGGDEKFRVTSTGSVGIGTNNPATKLQIVGSTSSAASSGGTLGIRQKGDASTDGITITSSHANSGRIFKDSSGHLHIYNTGGGVNDFVLQNTGNVGIGTASPDSHVHIRNNADATGATLKVADSSNRAITITSPIAQSAAAGRVAVTGTSNSLEIGVRDYPTALKIEGSSGNALFSSSVTVSKTSSGNILQVASLVNPVGASNTGVRLWMSGTNTTDRGTFIDAVAESTSNNHTLRFGTSASAAAPVERMRLDASGNLLVGTTSTNPQDGDHGFVARGNGYTLISVNNARAMLVNRASSDGDIISLAKAGTIFGNIGVIHGNNLFIGGTSHSGLQFGGSIIYPTGGTGSANDATVDLGGTSTRFKDLHLSGVANAAGFQSNQPTDGFGYVNFGDTGDANIGQIGYDHTDNYMRFQVNNTEKVRITNSGNVGIGTDAPSRKLEVDFTGSTIGARFTRSDTTGSSTIEFANSAGVKSVIGFNAGNNNFDIQNGGAVRLAVSNTGAVTFNSAFTFPTTIGSAGQVLKVPNSGSVLVWSDQTGGGGSTDSISDADGDTKIQVEESADEDIIRFDTAGSQRMVILANGNVGINNTSPSAKLTASGTTLLELPSSTNTFRIQDSQNSVERFRVTQDGSVGIGTSAPAGNLHIKSKGNIGDAKLIIEADADNNVESDNPRIELRQDSNLVSGSLYLEGNAGTTATNTIDNALVLDSKGALNNQAIQFATGGRAAAQSGGESNSTVAMTILGTNRNVGIGTTSPSAKVHIIHNATTDAMILQSTEDSSSAAPVLTLKRNSSSPADADYLGQLKFKGENDADQEVVYAKITAKIIDASDGSEDGLIEFANRRAGASVITARLRSDSLQLLDGTNLSVAGDATITGNLTVNGTQTILNTATLDVEDNNITLNKGSGDTSGSANGAGITIQDAVDASTDATLTWNTATDSFNTSHSFNVIGNISLTNDLVYNANTNFDIKNPFASQNITFHTTASGASTAEKMRIQHDGYVGIGTSSPGKELDVLGTVRAKDSSANQHQLRADKIISYGTDAILQAQSSGDDVRLNTTGNVTRLIATAEGYVGIGTSSPARKLEVDAGSASMVAQFKSTLTSSFVCFANSSSTADQVRIGSNGTALILSTNYAERARIDTSGNMGLGITNPSSYWGQADNLVVGGTGNDGITIKSSAAGNGRLAFTDTASSTAGLNDGGQIHYNHGSDYMALRTNGAERMRIDSVGQVGIGNTAPAKNLHITDSTSPTIRFSRDNSFYWDIGHTSSDFQFISESGGTVLHMNYDGNVGVGTDSPDTLLELFADNPVLRLRDSKVKGSSWAAGDALGGLEFYTSDTTGIGTHTVASITAVNGGQSTSSPDGEIVFSTGAYNTAASEVMRIDSSGNVGIGTTSPAFKLDVQVANGNTLARFKDSDSSHSGIIIAGDTNAGWVGNDVGVTGEGIYYQSSNNFMRFYTNSSEQMRIDNSGRLLVNATSTVFNDKLYIGGDGYATGGWRTGTGATFVGELTNLSGKLALQSDASRDIQLGDTNNPDIVYIDTSAQRVGIGTTSPSFPLHTKTTGNTVAKFETSLTSDLAIQLTNSQGSMFFGLGGGEEFAVGTTSDLNGSGNLFTIKQNGRVGFGTTNPKAKLQVEEYGIDTTSTSTSATTQVAIHTFPIANFRSARFTIQITNTTDSTYHSTEILAIHDGTTANITEFGEVHTGSSVEATFDADVSSGNFRLLATPTSTNSMTFKVVCHSLTV